MKSPVELLSPVLSLYLFVFLSACGVVVAGSDYERLYRSGLLSSAA